MNPHQIVTTHLVEEVPAENGYFKSDGVYNKICVVERHGKTGEIGVAPLKGFGVKGGAVATSVAHDSHNLIVAGDNDEDILAAIKGVWKKIRADMLSLPVEKSWMCFRFQSAV